MVAGASQPRVDGRERIVNALVALPSWREVRQTRQFSRLGCEREAAPLAIRQRQIRSRART
jgi:hypothetical protein